jgi:hypothetical protein
VRHQDLLGVAGGAAFGVGVGFVEGLPGVEAAGGVAAGERDLFGVVREFDEPAFEALFERVDFSGADVPA